MEILDESGRFDDLELTSSTDVPSDRRRQVAVTAGVTIGVLALLGGLLVLTNQADDDAAPPTTTSGPPTTPTVTPPDDTPEAMLELMPAGPIDGKDSWRLPVLISPQSGVVDGQVITALGRGFNPGEQVGVVMCTSEAAVEGVAACELGVENDPYRFVTYAYADAEGSVIADVVLRQVITTPFTGPVDCVSAPERCLVAIGAVSDYDRSGGSFVGFAGAPPFPTPVMSVDPPGPYIDRQVVTVATTGLLATRDVEVLQCRDLYCTVLAKGIVADDGRYLAEVELVAAFLDPATNAVIRCDDACVLAVTGIGLDEATAAPAPAPVPLGLLAIVPVAVPSTPPPSEPIPTAPPSTVVATTVLPSLVPTTPVTTAAPTTVAGTEP